MTSLNAMTDNAVAPRTPLTPLTPPTPLTLLGTGAMGTALARVWLAAGHEVTVWNRTAARAEPLAAEGATVAASAADAVAANRLVIVCLLDDASVGEALDGADPAGRDLVNLTTGTPAEGRARAAWAEARGARFLDAGIMAVPDDRRPGRRSRCRVRSGRSPRGSGGGWPGRSRGPCRRRAAGSRRRRPPAAPP